MLSFFFFLLFHLSFSFIFSIVRKRIEFILQTRLECERDMCACSVVQLCLTLCNPMNCSQPGSSVHEIFQARILEWGAISSSRESSWSRSRDQTQGPCSSCISRWILYHRVTREAPWRSVLLVIVQTLDIIRRHWVTLPQHLLDIGLLSFSPTQWGFLRTEGDPGAWNGPGTSCISAPWILTAALLGRFCCRLILPTGN